MGRGYTTARPPERATEHGTARQRKGGTAQRKTTGTGTAALLGKSRGKKGFIVTLPGAEGKGARGSED